MKKILLISMAVILIASISMAQKTVYDTRSQIQIGVKAGTNLSSVYDTKSDNFNVDSKFGFVGGGFVLIPIGTFIGFHPELLFSQKGYTSSGSYLGIIDYKFSRTSNFIDVPLLFAIKPLSMLTFVAGPQFSYLVSQKDEITSGELTDEQIDEFSNDNLRKNTMCFLGGIDFSVKHVVIGARVGWDIQDNNGDGTSTDPRYKNVWYQATFGIKL